MFQKLINLVSRDYSMCEQDIELCKTFFVPIEAKENDLLIEEGSIAKHLYFVSSGFVRVFHHCRGVELTTQISNPADFVTAFDSFISLRSAQENLHCLTDCRLLYISKTDLDQLYKESKTWAMYIRDVYKKSIEFNEQRASDILLCKPEERYKKLICKSAEIIEQVPHHYIASFLGMQEEALNRIINLS